MLREYDVGIVKPPREEFQKKSTRAIEQDRPDVVQQRTDWIEYQSQVDPDRLVFVDETGFKTDMHRLRGWTDKGLRLVEAVLGGRWETNTLVHAVSVDGTRAAMVLDGPVDSVSFAEFCKRFLAPALQPGDLVVLDNLSSHKSTAANTAIEAVGAQTGLLASLLPGSQSHRERLLKKSSNSSVAFDQKTGLKSSTPSEMPC